MLDIADCDALSAGTMPTLRALLASHAPLILIDAASARVQVGVLEKNDSRWHSSTAEAGLAVFEGLAGLGFSLENAGGFVFCEGPGSILGIRTVASALRTWRVLGDRPVWSYRSLELASHAIGDTTLSLIADARRDHWHLSRLGGPIRRVPTGELPSLGRLATPEGFRQWSKLPPEIEVQTVSYDLSLLLPRVVDANLMQPCEAPDAFLHEAPSYATWTPRIHQAGV
jgi:tRNA threonylcarbamoyladenosine biosynthesis protein TsaB